MSLFKIINQKSYHCRCAVSEEKRVDAMPRRKDTKFTTFNDGSLDICSVKGRKIVETRQAGIDLDSYSWNQTVL